MHYRHLQRNTHLQELKPDEECCVTDAQNKEGRQEDGEDEKRVTPL